MARPLRIEYENAYYHVMNRGANYQNIFLTDKHKQLFLSLLEEITIKFSVEIHAFCLMDNHYHLLVCTPLANLSKAMRHLDGIYTQKFNQSEKRDGPLFRGRYKSILVQLEIYFLKVSRYIHLNPVSASLCKMPESYKWSSYPFFMEKKSLLRWLQTEFTLNFYQDVVGKSTDYFHFVNEGIDIEVSEFYGKTQLASILGDKQFVLHSLKKVMPEKKHSYLADINRSKKFPEIQIIFEVVSNYFNIDLKCMINERYGVANSSRSMAMYLAFEFCQISHRSISGYLKNISRESVASKISRFRARVKTDNILQMKVVELWDRLNEV